MNVIESGMQAPAFTIPGTNGRSVTQHSLEDYTEEGGVILLFYPFDFSPVCVAELCSFRDAEWLTVEKDIDVLGISPDSAYSHKQFIQQYDIRFPLLTDRLGDVAAEYGLLLNEFEAHPAVPKRSIVAVDADQMVRYVWLAESQYEAPEIEVLEETIAWSREGADD